MKRVYCLVRSGASVLYCVKWITRLEWLTFPLRSLWSHQLWPGVPITMAIGISSVILSKGIPKEALASESLKHNWQRTDINQSCRTSLDITANSAFPQEIKWKWKCLRLTQRACFINIYQVILLHWLVFASGERLCRCLHVCRVILLKDTKGVPSSTELFSVNYRRTG